MGHLMAYGISGDNYSDLNALKKAGIIDYHFLIHGGGNTPPAQFPKDCNAIGVSPILNNGNDGIAGWNGQASYYKNVAALGYMSAGGESEQAPEIDAIMDNLIFMDYGGAGTGGGTNNNVWYVTHPAPVHGHGAASYLETYGFVSDFWGWSVTGPGALNAKSHGVKEVGILVGNWMKGHSTAQDYVKLAQDYEAHGITCAGIVVWGGYGTNMNNLYNQFADWFKIWQAIWPPNMTTIDKRFAGGGGTTTTIGLKASNVSPIVGQSVTFTATLTANGAPITGKNVKIRHTIGSISYDDITAATGASGTLVYTTTFKDAGQRMFYAEFAGDATYSASTSSGVSVNVVASPSKPISAPAVCAQDAHTLDIFVEGNDKACWHNHYDGVNWGKWESLGGVITAAPAATSPAPGIIDVFVKGESSALYHKRFINGAWGPWESLGGVLTSAPSCCSYNGILDVFVLGTSAIYRRTMSSDTWGSWIYIE